MKKHTNKKQSLDEKILDLKRIKLGYPHTHNQHKKIDDQIKQLEKGENGK